MQASCRSMVIACGALSREINALRSINGWFHLDLDCLPASLHNRPTQITAAVAVKINNARAEGYSNIFVAYGDCGTAGTLDKLLDNEGVTRIAGAHCYDFYADGLFAELAESEPATFYLTDFLARHFETLVVRPLGMDRYPELQSTYFGNYQRLLYLSQTQDDDLLQRARQVAQRLGLSFAERHTGYGGLQHALRRFQEASHA